MLKNIRIKNFGPLKDLTWLAPSPSINVIIGENASGKTFLLKALYTAVRAAEEYRRGDDKRTFKQVLDDKLTWTFQADKLGDLVSKGQKDRLSFRAQIDKQQVGYKFSASAERGVGEHTENPTTRKAISLFLPAKEVLSLFHVIKTSRLTNKQFGFDDTYLDLVLALEHEARVGHVEGHFSSARKTIESLLTGRIKYADGKWTFKVGSQLFSIHQTAEGYKRISILDRLIVNRILTKKSILFVDEPDAVLHPTAILATMEALRDLASSGVQIFMATHSYFVMKKLFLMAKAKELNVQVVSLSSQGAAFSNLADGMPDNSIIDTSVKLFVEEMKIQG
ncbi:MAG: hypothetical protein A2051_06840 [Desulfovibrionales bacterium GWA2_65_9]|nr:MAG: hypothetical protein A2051_06840 [Desulfovibrionales bacterium GWA2_65_9]